MMKVVVGPISTLEFGGLLASRGWSIAVLTQGHPRFDSSSVVTTSRALSIRDSLRCAEFGVIVGSMSAEDTHEQLSVLRPDFVMVDVHRLSKAIGDVVSAGPWRVVSFGHSLDYDDDPSWVANSSREIETLCRVDETVITLLPSLRRPCDWLRAEPGHVGGDLTPDEVKEVLAQRRTAINVPSDGVDRACVEQLASASTVVLFVGSRTNDGGVPSMWSPDAVIKFGTPAEP